MFYLCDFSEVQFARRKGSKDKQKRKKYGVSNGLKEAAGMGLTIGAGAILGRKFLFKNATKALNSEYRNVSRVGRDLLKQGQTDELQTKLSQVGAKNLDLHEELFAGNQIRQMAKQKNISESQQFKNTMHDSYKSRYKALNQQKQLGGAGIAVSTVAAGRLGYGINNYVKARNANKRK